MSTRDLAKAQAEGVRGRLLSLHETARELGVSKRTVEAWVAAGTLPTVRLGTRMVRVDRADLEAFIDARRARA